MAAATRRVKAAIDRPVRSQLRTVALMAPAWPRPAALAALAGQARVAVDRFLALTAAPRERPGA